MVGSICGGGFYFGEFEEMELGDIFGFFSGVIIILVAVYFLAGSSNAVQHAAGPSESLVLAVAEEEGHGKETSETFPLMWDTNGNLRDDDSPPLTPTMATAAPLTGTTSTATARHPAIATSTSNISTGTDGTEMQVN